MGAAERARLRALCEAATPGPWTCDGVSIDPEDGYVFARQGANIRGTLIVLDDTYERCGSDMLLIAAARTALPALLDDSERLAKAERERDEARAEVERLRASEASRRELMPAVLDAVRKVAREEEREACVMIATPYAARWPCAGDIVAKIRARGAGGGA